MSEYSQYNLIIAQENLVKYFGTGIIKPGGSYDGWNKDVQSIFPNHLLLSNMGDFNPNQCCLELVLTNFESKELISIKDGYYLLNKPLPVSRIKKIIFPKGKSADQIYNIEQGDGFINTDVVVEGKATSNELSLPDFEDFDFKSWDKQSELYDKILGGFSLMQIAGLEDFSEYSENYFSYLGFINKEVQNQVKVLNNTFEQKNLKTIKIDSGIPKSPIFDVVNYDLVDKINSNKEVIPKDRLTGLIEIDEIKDKFTYIMAILSQYGDDYGKEYKIQDFISNVILNKFRRDVLEKLCLTFGINQGYQRFRNYYNITNHTVEIKFRLNSELDYTIIESIYQYVFNGNRNNRTFNYLNSWCPKFNGKVNERDFKYIRIIDKPIAIQKKVTVISLEYLENIKLQLSRISIFDNVKNKVSEILDKIFLDFKAYTQELEGHLKDSNECQVRTDIKELKSSIDNEGINLNKTSGIANNEESNDLFNQDSNLLDQRFQNLTKISTLKDLRIIGKYLGIKGLHKFNKGNLDELKEQIKLEECRIFKK